MTKQEKEVAATADAMPATYDSAEWEGLGSENATSADDFAIPFIQIAQALSPQLDRSDAKYIEGLEKNQLFNTVTGEVFGDGCIVIPVKYERKYLEFVLREQGGGLVDVHDTYDAEVLKRRDDKNRSIADNGHQIVETRSFYCIVQGKDGTWYPAMIGMKSTGLKKAKQWMSMVQGVQWTRSDGSPFVAPMFARKYRIGVAQEHKNGNTWGNWTIQRLDEEPLDPTMTEFQQAHNFYKTMGEYTVDYTQGEVPMQDED